MRRFAIGLGLFATTILAGCNGHGGGGGGPPHHGGRYVGIGIYAADALWQHLAGIARPANAQAATLADDDQIIVVVDSQTGEIRQCGNHSGHCIAMNPWSGRPAPVDLDTHAADLERGRATNSSEVADDATAPRRRPDHP